jgi:hypothetical protein
MIKKLMSKKVSIFGKKVSMFAIVLMSFALVSAALVPYLSNVITGNVVVSNPMEISLSNINGPWPTFVSPMVFSEASWVTDLNLPSTRNLEDKTFLVGLKVDNKASVAVEGKNLKLVFSNSANDITCGDITSLRFLDTGTQYQIEKGFQELKDLLCSVNGTTVVYNIPINSLAPTTVYQYPVEIKFGLVTPATYTFTAQMMNA